MPRASSVRKLHAQATVATIDCIADEGLPVSDPTPEERIWHVVAEIPPGAVASYGQVAELAGLPRGARRVGRCLARLPAETRLPWHRVVNAAGGISLPGAAGRRQRERLRDEGVAFEGDRVDLRRCRWSV